MWECGAGWEGDARPTAPSRHSSQFLLRHQAWAQTFTTVGAMTQRAAMLAQASAMIEAWEGRFGPFEPHPATVADPDVLAAAWDRFEERMGDHYPFFHPR